MKALYGVAWPEMGVRGCYNVVLWLPFIPSFF
jgi:hypothetical protein